MGALARDDLILDAIGNLVLATGKIGEVVVGAKPAEFAVGADRSSVAWIWRSSWVEQPSAGEFLTDRTVDFSVVLAVRGADERTGQRALIQIEAMVLNALDRKSYAGETYPSFSYVRRGDDMPAADSEYRVMLTGTFRFGINDPRTEHLETPIGA